MSDNIKVVVKVRPLISRELEEKLPLQWRLQNNTLFQLDSNGRDNGQTFTFDKVYNAATKTEDVYKDVAKPIVEAAIAGFNGTIFAYGQTSSGKTYTMTGTDVSPGIIPLAVINLFENIKNIPNRDFLVRVSYIEIYNETVKDLLDVKRENIKIHETYEGSIKVDASERVKSSPEDVLDAMREGEANRQTGATNMNEKSSRSHSIFQITIESREHIEGEEQAGCVNVSQLNLVDLAGSERAGQTGATGIRFKEGTHINKSLSALALVIKQLSEGPNKYANYRDSKLTRILQNSLGGNAKTSIICAITPAALEETVSTLQFATRAKAIKNKPEVNAVATDATMIQSLTKQLSQLQSQLESKKNLEVMLESKKSLEQDLQKQIANLQKLILNGFGQGRSVEQLGGTRRKLQPPRRVTISTLHSIEDDPVPVPHVPKFRTPSLKYNPLSIPKPSDFAPIQSFNKLPTMLEEPPRLTTPPPTEKRVNFNNEVIEIDSDDDNNSSNCSTYHKCYNCLSKTPPCVLRDQVKKAEEDYKSILQLTELEKMFEPDVVELMKKLEQKTNMTIELQEQLEILQKNDKEKDLEMDHLKCKIRKTEEEILNTKLELETTRHEYKTKLTDWEVSYETLKKKTKLREEELLSRLEEHEKKDKKCEDIGKLPAKPTDKDPINFMNMSKDISLVNSDNESSIITPTEEEDSLDQMKCLVSNLQDQLIEKCQTIVQLEANIASQKQSIEFLEQSSDELQGLVDSFKTKLIYAENENELLQSTVNTLNSTIESLKKNLEIAQNDMESYNNVIQDLQIKLTKKDNLLNMNITDSVLESMIANEEKVIANNENMKNIIHSFKIALNNRSKDIHQLKLTIQECSDSQNKAIIEESNEKTRQIEILSEEVSRLTEKYNENIKTIHKLMTEKSNLASVEQNLNQKLAESEIRKTELDDLYKESTLHIENLKETNIKLLHSLSEKNTNEQEYIKLNSELQNKIKEYTSKINQIEEEIKSKDNIILTLQKENECKAEYENQAKMAIDKIKGIVSILSGEVQEIPELIDNFVNLFNVLSTVISTLEEVANNTLYEKNVILKQNSQLKTDISDLNSKYNTDTEEFQHEIENLKTSLDDLMADNTNLKDANNKLVDEILIHQKEINSKHDEYNILLSQYNNYKDAENTLRVELLRRQEIMSRFNEKEAEFNNKIEELEAKLRETKMALKSEHDQVQVKDTSLNEASNTIAELKKELSDKCVEITIVNQKLSDLAQENAQLIQNIYGKFCDVLTELNIENCVSCKEINDVSYENFSLILDKIFNSIVNSKKNIKSQLNESSKQYKLLYDEKQKLQIEFSQIENENKTLLREIEIKHLDAQNISENVIVSNELLEQLKHDLKCKAAEIENMTMKAIEWKEQFINLDSVMKQQMQELQQENEKIKALYQKLKDETQMQINVLSDETNNYNSHLRTSFSMSEPNDKNGVETFSPPSLFTICCNKIPGPKANDYIFVTKPDCSSKINSTAVINSCSTCDQLSLELRSIQEENVALSAISEQLDMANKNLIKEQDIVREEVLLLLEQAQELQKKIASHKTNLSILTATTYAENRSLKSQVKGLQHHHSRFHNVCQRDIPEFKKQLNQLMFILKGDTSASEIQNVNFKRFSLPDVLDSNTTVCNESALDGDLLMLDTNVTLTTTGDNTVVGYDQTCLDLTQTMFNEVSCQTNDPNETDPNLNSPFNVLEIYSQNIFQQLELLKEENSKLKALLELKPSKIDAQSSPMKLTNSFNDDVPCIKCQIQLEISESKVAEEDITNLTQRLTDLQQEKNSYEKKYNNLLLEIPNIDTLANKLKAMENEYNIKAHEVAKLTGSLNIKNKELKTLQEENDALSTQVMENISEADDLNKELDRIRNLNTELAEKNLELESKSYAFKCSACQSKDDNSVSIKIKDSPRVKLNRSLSDSDTSSRNNKICTLQSELYAGREDCKELTEDVATIKLHLDCSNMSMDLDESMGDTNVFSQAIDFTENVKCFMPEIQEERSLDIYTLERNDCCNYYLEITGRDKEDLSNDVKMIDVMKMFYNNLVTKHGNEIENLMNKLKDFEESRNELQMQVDDMAFNQSKITKALEKKEKDLNTVSKFISGIKSNINHINEELSGSKDKEALAEIVSKFNNFLNTLDFEFGMTSFKVFEIIVDKYQDDLYNIEKHCLVLKNETEKLNTELDIANSNLESLKSNLAEKESEYNLLKAQKDKILEISSAVTLDIVRKEEDMQKSLTECCQKLFDLNLINAVDLIKSESAVKSFKLLIDRVISQHKQQNDQQKENEREMISFELDKYKASLERTEIELTDLKTQIQTLKDLNNNVTLSLSNHEIQLQSLRIMHDDLNIAYDSKNQENISNLHLIHKLTEEIASLKEKISHNELAYSTSSSELINSMKKLREENDTLKSMNQIILKEKETYSMDLVKSSATIKANVVEMEKMTADILELRDSLKNSTSAIDLLKQEAHKLLMENAEIKQNLEEKNQSLNKLEKNIKTHEKTAELQSAIIIRLNKQKEEHGRELAQKQTEVDLITEKYNVLQNEFEEIKKAKESLQTLVSELQEAADKPRTSLDGGRLRRQSLHDCKRALEHLDEHKHLEAVFESRQKPDDLFMDIDGDDTSGRSTPFGLGKGRDSLLSRNDQMLKEGVAEDLGYNSRRYLHASPPRKMKVVLERKMAVSDKDEDQPSRPSSVLATRRRRQSIHDMHRGVARLTPSPHDLSSRVTDELHHFKDTSGDKGDSSEVNQLREKLTSCQQELEELKERYRELDEECETCAEYLKERDEQCSRLKKENTALEKQIEELKCSVRNTSQSRPSVTHVAVNTDEDWANLHAVVVDRMSYDAEVEKNKRLTKCIEELRFKQQDLKHTMAKMQKALQKHSYKDVKELEATREELESVKKELEELKIKYKELDEECETCAEYLKESEEQCRRLKEAKAVLESKVLELQEDSHAAAAAHSHSVRKKRQTIHDANRPSVLDLTDASTEITDDLPSYKSEQDESSQKANEDTKRLKMMIEVLTHQKMALEKQLKTSQANPTQHAMYVATGSAIVQNQQLTDVMKENQRLKKINAKLITICKKRKDDANRENEDPQQG